MVSAALRRSRHLASVRLSVLLIGLLGSAAWAAEYVASPCRILNPLTGIIYNDSYLLRKCMALNSQAIDSYSPGVAVFIDISGVTSKLLTLPYGRGGWDILRYSDSQLYFESENPLYLININPAFNNPAVSASWQLPSENLYAWRLAKDSAGRIYAGSWPTGKLYRLDPSTGTQLSFGPLGPQGNPNSYVRHVAVANDNGSDVVVSALMGGDSCNSEVTPADDGTCQQVYPIGSAYASNLVSVGGTVYAAIGGALQIYDPASNSFSTTGLPTPPTGTTWTDISRTSEPSNLLLKASDNSWYYVGSNGVPVRNWYQDLKGGFVVGRWWSNPANPRIVGFRGQRYFVHSVDYAGAISWRTIAPESQIPPVSIHFLTDDGVNRTLTGAPPAGQTLFQFDPSNNTYSNTDVVSNELGEVYGGVWRFGKFYFASYVGGELSQWDPSQPWDQFNDVNPKLLVKYKNSDALKNPVRPRGRVTLGPSIHVYTGWSAGYGQTDGCLTRADVTATTPPAVGWRTHTVLGVTDGSVVQSIGRIAGDSFGIYGLTSNKFDGVSNPPAATDVYFWHFDPNSATNQFKRNTLGGYRGDGCIVRVPSTGNIWFTTHSGVYCYNPPSKRIIGSKVWPSGTPTLSANTIFGQPDAEGKLAWFPVLNRIIEVQDNSVGTTFSATISLREQVGDGSKNITVLCKSVDGLWACLGPELWKTTVPDVSCTPGAPVGIVIKAASSTSMDVSWADSAHNETGFYIERKPDGGTFQQVGQVGANVETFTDTNLTPATWYTYRVRAYNAQGNSAYTAEARTYTPGS